MSINDVLTRLQDGLQIYTFTNFNRVPTTSGVYAWFYPLLLPHDNLDKFNNGIIDLMNFQSMTGTPNRFKMSQELSWETISVTTDLSPKPSKILESDTNHAAWRAVLENVPLRDLFRNSLLLSSILMPPLYIGKTDNLQQRCQQHRQRSSDKSTFAYRFTTRAAEIDATFKTVQDLIFVTIVTGENIEERDQRDNVNTLLEESLKSIAKPVFGYK